MNTKVLSCHGVGSQPPHPRPLSPFLCARPVQAAAAEVEAALAACAARPVVLRGGAHVAAAYREVVLRPAAEGAGGRAAWAAAGGGLHLYYHQARGKWCLNTAFAPEENTCLAYVRSPALLPPAGEATWELEVSLRGAGDEAEAWADGVLTLLLGEAAEARARPACRAQPPTRAPRCARCARAAAATCRTAPPHCFLCAPLSLGRRAFRTRARGAPPPARPGRGDPGALG